MDKDRDISRTIYTSKKVGLVGSAFLAVSLAACGGGAVKSEKTGVVVTNPAQGAGVLQGHDVPSASATAVREAPTVAPAATVEAEITQEQADQLAGQLSEWITEGLSNPKLTNVSINQAGGEGRYLDPDYAKKAIANCDLRLYGQQFFSVNLNRTVTSTEPDYSSLYLVNCAQPVNVAKSGFKATGDQRFKDAGDAWKTLHKRAFDFVKGQDPKVTATWQDVQKFYYQW